MECPRCAGKTAPAREATTRGLRVCDQCDTLHRHCDVCARLMYVVGIWGDVAGNRRVVRPVVAKNDPRSPKEYLRELVASSTEYARVLIPSPAAKLPPGAESTPCFVGDLSGGAGANRAELAKKMRAPDLVLGEGITWHCRHCHR